MNLRFVMIVAFCALAFSAFAGERDDSDILVPAHDIARGAVLTALDLTPKTMPVMRINADILRNADDVVGREAKRALRAGEVLRASDLKRPTLVAKGSTVTMLFEAPGMRLSASGRALGEGGKGDVIQVLNPTSYRQVEATVIAAGMVRVGTPEAPEALSRPRILAAQP
jgi:flagella basal body P-ring formation protein FlgA